MPQGIYKVPFSIGDHVYLKTDVEQLMRIITAICINVSGAKYLLSYNTSDSWHYDFEFTAERDIIKATSN